jgi:hypothetical protein
MPAIDSIRVLGGAALLVVVQPVEHLGQLEVGGGSTSTRQCDVLRRPSLSSGNGGVVQGPGAYTRPPFSST